MVQWVKCACAYETATVEWTSIWLIIDDINQKDKKE